MSKATVTRFFIGGMLAVLAGALLGVATVWIAIANDVFVMNGPDVVGLQWSALTWSLLGVGIVAASAMVGGMLAGLVAWIGALVNTSALQRKTWFVVLLLAGIFSFGFIAMIVYVIAGPDGTAGAATPRTQVAATATTA
jgi:hypothetical protein